MIQKIISRKHKNQRARFMYEENSLMKKVMWRAVLVRRCTILYQLERSGLRLASARKRNWRKDGFKIVLHLILKRLQNKLDHQFAIRLLLAPISLSGSVQWISLDKQILAKLRERYINKPWILETARRRAQFEKPPKRWECENTPAIYLVEISIIMQ